MKNHGRVPVAAPWAAPPYPGSTWCIHGLHKAPLCLFTMSRQTLTLSGFLWGFVLTHWGVLLFSPRRLWCPHKTFLLSCHCFLLSSMSLTFNFCPGKVFYCNFDVSTFPLWFSAVPENLWTTDLQLERSLSYRTPFFYIFRFLRLNKVFESDKQI